MTTQGFRKGRAEGQPKVYVCLRDKRRQRYGRGGVLHSFVVGTHVGTAGLPACAVLFSPLTSRYGSGGLRLTGLEERGGDRLAISA